MRKRRVRKDQCVSVGLILLLVVLVGVGLWKTSPGREHRTIAVVRQCHGIMGTDGALVLIVPPQRRDRAEAALHEAETLLRSVEARMSTWLDNSEFGCFNAATAGEEVPLSPAGLHVLRTARQANARTGGAFDVTCRPLVELWQRAGERDALPDESELARARAASNWDLVELSDSGATKRGASARVDLGGVAKGYGIDRAVGLLRSAGHCAGMVDIGGDLACFGSPPGGNGWPVDVKNPTGPGRLARLRVREGAVCTSGNYARFTEIAGKRYSHIIDPRTGRPVDAVLSATVLAPKAVTADIWATALSVLGLEGFGRLPDGVEAMIVVAAKDDCQVRCTVGFRELLETGGRSPESRVESPE